MITYTKITDPRYRNYNLYIQSEGSWTPEGKGPHVHRLYKSYDGTLIKDKLQGTYSCKPNRIKTQKFDWDFLYFWNTCTEINQ